MTSPSCPPLPGLVQGLLVMASLSTLCLSFPMPVLGKVSLGPSGCLESPKGTFEGVLRAEGGDPRDQRRGKPQSPGKGTEGTKTQRPGPQQVGTRGAGGKGLTHSSVPQSMLVLPPRTPPPPSRVPAALHRRLSPRAVCPGPPRPAATPTRPGRHAPLHFATPLPRRVPSGVP